MKTLKEIALEIEGQADNFPVEENHSSKAQFRFGSLTLRCRNSREAVLNLAKRLRKGIRNYYGTSEEYSRILLPTDCHNGSGGLSAAFENFVSTSETENGLQLAKLCNKPIYYARFEGGVGILQKAQEVQPGFVVGRVWANEKLHPWNVTHLDTGLSCSSEGSTKKGSLEKFRKIPEGNIEKAVEAHPAMAGFQEKAPKILIDRLKGEPK